MNSVLNFILALAIILFATKIVGLGFRKLGLPQVLGYIVAGILIGPAIFGDFLGWSLISTGDNNALVTLTAENGGSTALSIFSKIGVLLIMFISGLETDLKELKKTGVISTVIACVGVAVPIALGFCICLPFVYTGVLNTPDFTFDLTTALFIGVILTATSVAITVSVLRELGKLQGRVGTILLSAAIIDDIIGIVVLSIVIGVAGSGDGGSGLILGAIMKAGAPASLEPLFIVLLIIAFFGIAIGGGIGINKLFKYLDKRWPQSRRIPVLSLVVCFVYAYVAEEVFGVADISGAFVAGLLISTNPRNAQYVDQKLDVTSYLFFSPVFFAGIGINMNLSGVFSNGWMLLLILAVVAIGLISKVVGCGLTARCFKMNKHESLIVGVGMMARGEVALIVTEKGINAKLLTDSYYIVTVMLILFSAVLTPIFLKLLYSKRDKHREAMAEAVGAPVIATPPDPTDLKYLHSVKIFMGDAGELKDESAEGFMFKPGDGPDGLGDDGTE